MVSSKILIASLILSALVIQLVQAIPYQVKPKAQYNLNCTAYVPPTSGKIDCGLACNARCCKSGRPNVCLRACNTCCYRCNCVPPGTYGNYEVCPCYGAMTTGKDKRHKCP